MSQWLPSDGINFERNVCLEEILNTPDDSDSGYFFEVDLKYLYITSKKQNISPFVLKIKFYLKLILLNI